MHAPTCNVNPTGQQVRQFSFFPIYYLKRINRPFQGNGFHLMLQPIDGFYV